MVTTRAQERAEASSPALVNKRKRFDSEEPESNIPVDISGQKPNVMAEEEVLPSDASADYEKEGDQNDDDEDAAPETVSSKDAARQVRALPNRSLRHTVKRRKVTDGVIEKEDLLELEIDAEVPVAQDANIEDAEFAGQIAAPSDAIIELKVASIAEEPTALLEAVTPTDAVSLVEADTLKEPQAADEEDASTRNHPVQATPQSETTEVPLEMSKDMTDERAPAQKPIVEISIAPADNAAEISALTADTVDISEVATGDTTQEHLGNTLPQEPELSVKPNVSTLEHVTGQVDLSRQTDTSVLASNPDLLLTDNTMTEPSSSEVIVMPPNLLPEPELQQLVDSTSDEVAPEQQQQQKDMTEVPVLTAPDRSEENSEAELLPMPATRAQEELIPETPKSITSGIVTPVWNTRTLKDTPITSPSARATPKVVKRIRPRSSLSLRHQELLSPKPKLTSLQRYRDSLLNRHTRTTEWGPPGYRKTKFAGA